uniref:Uncharacterized protein n=1 Tax=Heterorhabditis bacteriophora TaxID=37862 RepID=A0A1I7X0X0_HETBA
MNLKKAPVMWATIRPKENSPENDSSHSIWIRNVMLEVRVFITEITTDVSHF